jgi:hypothetical protein
VPNRWQRGIGQHALAPLWTEEPLLLHHGSENWL